MGGGAGELGAECAVLYHPVCVAVGCYGDFDEEVVGFEVFGHGDFAELMWFVVLRQGMSGCVYL